jgi:hypothetical protein
MLSRTANEMLIGTIAGLALALGLATLVAGYVKGPGQAPARRSGDSRNSAPLPAWPDPNIGMRHKEDRAALIEMIRRQDEESASRRAAITPTGSPEKLPEQESPMPGPGEGFEIEYRPRSR